MNYAWGGAETGDGISTRGTPNVGLQIQTFLAANGPENGQLFVIFAGANDFNNADVLPDPAQIAANVVDHVRTLADAGAKHILVPSLPPLGQTPRVVGTPDELLLDLLSIEFNIRLAFGLRAIEREFDIDIIRPRFFAIFELIINVPELFGFENVTGTVKLNPIDFYDTGVVDNPDAYLFFDDVHPTRVAHEIIGRAAAFQVRLLSRRRR